MGIGGLVIAVALLCWCCSTAETRAQGAEAARPYARAAGWIAAGLIAAIVVLPHS